MRQLLRNWLKPALKIENWQANGFGLYIHWPFCETKCPYCDFNSYADQSFDEDEWAAAYVQDIQRYAEELPNRTLSSIYFGGGTPSLMSADMVSGLIDAATSAWSVSNTIEITLEANPSTVETAKFQDFKTAGINRVSLGVQALEDTALRRLGRHHSASDAIAAIETVKGVFERSSFDLIYARQDQSLNAWEAELKEALGFEPSHLSLYQLTIEPGTVFAKRQSAGQLKGLPSDDLGADMYELTQVLCTDHGLHAYEVSNHARHGEESRHNFIYWNSGDYVGIGPGAHGRITLGSDRFGTETALWPKKWLDGTKRETRAEISQPDQLTELLLMGLRTYSGVELSRAQDMGFKPDAAEGLVAEGLVQIDKDSIKVTRKGRPLLNAILVELIS